MKKSNFISFAAGILLAGSMWYIREMPMWDDRVRFSDVKHHRGFNCPGSGWYFVWCVWNCKESALIYTVKKYDHYFSPKLWGLKFGRGVKRTVKFDKSCAYSIKEEDQFDWNKLFGVSYLTGVHRHSYRFGWRYNPLTGFIELAAYCYQGGVRSYQELGEVSFDRLYTLEIEQKGNKVVFLVNGQIHAVLVGKLPLIGWKLGPYFGGNWPAPHKMKIEIYA